MDRCFLFASLLSPISNTYQTTYAASSTAINSTVKDRRLNPSEMAQVRVGELLSLMAVKPFWHQANTLPDWRTFAQVEAGRPFYPLFKDEVGALSPSLAHQSWSAAKLISLYSTPPPTTSTSQPPETVRPTLQMYSLFRMTTLLPSS